MITESQVSQLLVVIDDLFPHQLSTEKGTLERVVHEWTVLLQRNGVEMKYCTEALSRYIEHGHTYPPQVSMIIAEAKQAEQDAEAEKDRPYYEAAFREAEETAALPPSKEEQAEIDAEAQRKFDERRKRIDTATRKSKTPEP